MKKPLFSLYTLGVLFLLQAIAWWCLQIYLMGYRQGYRDSGNECIRVINSMPDKVIEQLKLRGLKIK